MAHGSGGTSKSNASKRKAAKNYGSAQFAADMVTRRQFVAWLGVGAAAVAAGPMLAGCSAPLNSVDPRATEARDLQFRFPDLPSTISDLVLSVQGKHYPIQAHSVLSRSKMHSNNPLGANIDQNKLTHYAANVDLPANVPVEFMIWGTDQTALRAGMPVSAPIPGQANGQGALGQEPGSVYIGGGISAPIAAMRTIYQAAEQVKPISEVMANDVRVKAWGMSKPPSSVDEAVAFNDLHDVPLSVAAKLVFKIPGVTNMSATGNAVAMGIINSNQQLTGLSNAVETFLTKVGVYGSTEPQMGDPSGKPIGIYDPSKGPQPTDPQANVFMPFISDGATYHGQPIPVEWTTALRTNIASAGVAVANQIQDATSLQQTPTSIAAGNGGNWVVSDGQTPQVIEKSAADKLVLANAGKPLVGSPQATYAVSPSGFTNQLKVEITGDATPAKGPDGKVIGANVPIRVYNNNEQFFNLYRQSFAGTKQLETESNVSDDDYTTALLSLDAGSAGAKLSTVNVVMGVPLFDTNWEEYNFLIGDGATEGRLLACTLGSGTSWKNYFKDSSGGQLYSDNSNPQETTEPIIWTSIVNLGLPFLFLIADCVAMGNVYKVAADECKDATEAAMAQVKQLIKAFSGVSGLEFIVNSIICGKSVPSDIGSGSILQWVAPLAKMIWTILVNGVIFKAIVEAVLEVEAAEKVADAIPIVGEVFAALCLVADMASLATAVGEILSNPWVTPFRITGTYTSTIKVTKSPKDAVFPRSATSWTLTPSIEGDSTLSAVANSTFSWQDKDIDPKTGSFTQQFPNVPIGSRIRWKITFHDKNGWIVGMGSTDWLDNFDPTKLPSPEITITELEPHLGKDMTYDLNATTQWDSNRSGGAGITWSDQTSVPGSIADQSKTGPESLPAAGSLAVGTITGTAGFVYKTDKGWKVAQVGTTNDPNMDAIVMPQTYVRQPILVYDSMSKDPVNGHNYILEPYDKTGEYLVRKLDLTKPGYGLPTLGKDQVEVLGRFPAEMHGAVLHPAGYIIGFNTDTGRLQTLSLSKDPILLDPAPTDLQLFNVPTAILTAGSGNLSGARPGLVQQPVDLAAGLNGIVLVLEQGAKRIQAFNHVGAPTPYFPGESNSLSYYLDLSKDSPIDTYTSLGVDGVGFMYVHGYKGDGSSSDQYGVSVFNAKGENVVPFANKVNAAAMTVDYWRNIYTQDYMPMQQAGGGTYLGNDGVAQPAISIWIPDDPATPPSAFQGVAGAAR